MEDRRAVTQGKAVSLPWKQREDRPFMPDDLPAPPLPIDPEAGWHELEAEDGHRLAVAFTGTGRHGELVMGYLYCWPPLEDDWRDPTFAELRSASGLCHLEGCVFELPPWPGGLELPADAVGIQICFRQRGAVDGTEAALRFSLSAGIAPPRIVKG